MRIRCGAALTALIAATCPLMATTLEFETKQLSQQVTSLADPIIDYTFSFRNTGSKPVTITGVSLSCGCSGYALDRNSLQPGERGVLIGNIDLAKKRDAQPVRIAIETDEGGPPSVLTMVVKIASGLFTIMPQRIVSWRLGEAAISKTITFRFANDSGLSLKKVVVQSTSFRVRVMPQLESGTIQLEITPVSTQSKAGALILPDDSSTKSLSELLRVYAIVY